MENFTTALATYTIEQHAERHVDRFEDNAPIWEEVTTYRIFKEGNLLTVCYNVNDIPMVINCQERPERYAGMNNRFD